MNRFSVSCVFILLVLAFGMLLNIVVQNYLTTDSDEQEQGKEELIETLHIAEQAIRRPRIPDENLYGDLNVDY